MYLHVKNPYELKYQYLMKKREEVGVKHFKDTKAFMEYSNDVNDVCKSTEKCNPRKEGKVLIVFDEMIADIISDKKTSPRTQ